MGASEVPREDEPTAGPPLLEIEFDDRAAEDMSRIAEGKIDPLTDAYRVVVGMPLEQLDGLLRIDHRVEGLTASRPRRPLRLLTNSTSFIWI